MTPSSALDAAVRRPGLTGAADAIVAELLFGDAPDRIAAVTRDVAAGAGLAFDDGTQVLYRLVVRDPTFLVVEPTTAIEAQLRSLLILGRVKHASLWLRSGEGTEVCVAAVGATEPRQPVRAAARHALNGRGNGATDLRAVPVGSNSGLAAALIFQTTRGKARLGTTLARESAIALGPILERRRLLDESFHSAGQLLDAVERRLARLGFDIHDGPMQHLSLLAGELTMLARTLPTSIADRGARAEAEQRLAHLTELALDVGRELRDLSRSAATRGRAPLREELVRETTQLEERTGIDVHLSVHGNVEQTTASQRIAVHRVVEEALTNVREHSRATTVHVTLRRDPDFLNLTIEDDGDGFDVSGAFKQASRDGRLGLVSMSERVRLLGGQLDVTSRPGGPTVIIAVIPAWAPPAVRLQSAPAEAANAVA